MYAAMATRPDIAFASQLLSRWLGKSTDRHLQAPKHLLRYLFGTMDHGIAISKGKRTGSLEVYSDADFVERH